MDDLEHPNLVHLLLPDGTLLDALIDFGGTQLPAGTKCKAKLENGERFWIRVLKDVELSLTGVSQVQVVEAKKVDDVEECVADFEKIIREVRYYRQGVINRVRSFKILSDDNDISGIM
jgi:hypothetical protein